MRYYLELDLQKFHTLSMLNIKIFLGCMKTDPTVYWPIFITIVTFSTGAAFTISSIKRMIEHFKVIYKRLECKKGNKVTENVRKYL